MTELDNVFILKYILDVICQEMVTFFSLAIHTCHLRKLICLISRNKSCQSSTGVKWHLS